MTTPTKDAAGGAVEASMGHPSLKDITMQVVQKLRGAANYDNWQWGIRLILEEHKVLNVVLGTESEPTAKAPAEVKEIFGAKNRRGLIILASNVDITLMSHIKPHKLAKDAWAELESVFASHALAHQLYLREKYRGLKQKDGETVQSFSTRLQEVAQELATSGAPVDQQEQVLKLLEGVLPIYAMVATALEVRGTTLSYADALTSLLHSELRRGVEEEAKDQAYLAKNGKKHFEKKGQKKNGPVCFYCQKPGHIKKDCYALKRKQQQQQGPTKKTPDEPNNSKGEGAKPDFVFTSGTSPLGGLDDWHVDSGATKHMAFDYSLFSNLVRTTPQPVYMGNNNTLAAKGIGDVPITLVHEGREHRGVLRNVLYVPGLATNLVSVRQLVEHGFAVNFAKDRCTIEDSEGTVLAKAYLNDKLYRLSTKQGERCHAARIMTSPAREAQLWHERFGHLGVQSLQQLAAKGMVSGLPSEIGLLPGVCEGCMLGRQARESFPTSSSKEVEPLALVHTDLCGPMKVPSLGGAKYFMILTDDATGYKQVYFLKSKDQALAKFKEYKASVESLTDHKIKRLRSDRGKEFVNKAFCAFMDQHGIARSRSAPYTPQQNGVAERANRTIMEAARSMLHGKGLPSHLWAEAVAAAVFVRNIAPVKFLDNMTPAEAFLGKKPNASYLRAFGCKAYVHIPDAKRTKLDPKSHVCVFTGYDMESKAYRFYDPAKNTIVISRDVAFDEGGVSLQPLPTQVDDPFPLLAPIQKLSEGFADMTTSMQASAAPGTEVSAGQNGTPHREEGGVPSETPSAEEGEHSDWITEGPRGVRPLSSFFGGPATQQAREQAAVAYADSSIIERAFVAIDDTPTTYHEAVSGPRAKEWAGAAADELASIQKHGTWELVELPPGRRAVGSKWIFTIKRDAAGNVKRYKARLVAKGYAQVEGLDYTETFAPVAKFTSIRVLLTLAAAHDWEVHHMDVKTAFLNGDLEEEVYMDQPEGCEEVGKEDLVCRLKKSLYGLKQAPRAWNIKLHEELSKLGFIRLEADHSVYARTSTKGQSYLLIYVDDMLIVASCHKVVKEMKEDLSKVFTMTDLGEASYFLGLEFSRDRGAKRIFLHQGGYIAKMLEKYGMADCRPVRTPFPSGFKLPPGEEGAYPLQAYQSAVGSLMYLMVGTRPDLAFAVGAVSQFLVCPTKTHWEAVKHIFRYVSATAQLKLALGQSKGEPTVVGYSDADWAANDINRRSISGYAFKLGEGAISWASKKQTSVALSSTEAEYMALTQACKEAIWIKHYLTELGVQREGPLLIRADNQSCIALARNPEFHARTKHIDIQYHFIREKVEGGEVALEYCSTKAMVADVLTKPTTRDKHEWCTKALGLVPADLKPKGE